MLGIFGTLGGPFLELFQSRSAAGLSRKRTEKRSQIRFLPRRILLDLDDEEVVHEEDYMEDKDDKD